MAVGPGRRVSVRGCGRKRRADAWREGVGGATSAGLAAELLSNSAFLQDTPVFFFYLFFFIFIFFFLLRNTDAPC